MAKSIWKSGVGKDADEKAMRPHNKSKRRFCPKERKKVFNVQAREEGSMRICGRTAEKKIY